MPCDAVAPNTNEVTKQGSEQRIVGVAFFPTREIYQNEPPVTGGHYYPLLVKEKSYCGFESRLVAQKRVSCDNLLLGK